MVYDSLFVIVCLTESYCGNTGLQHLGFIIRWFLFGGKFKAFLQDSQELSLLNRFFNTCKCLNLYEMQSFVYKHIVLVTLITLLSFPNKNKKTANKNIFLVRCLSFIVCLTTYFLAFLPLPFLTAFWVFAWPLHGVALHWVPLQGVEEHCFVVHSWVHCACALPLWQASALALWQVSASALQAVVPALQVACLELWLAQVAVWLHTPAFVIFAFWQCCV